MKRSFFAVLYFVAATSGHADLTIVNVVESDGKTQEMAMYLKGKQALVRVSPQLSVLTNGESGDSWMLLSGQKKAVRISGSSMKAMLDQWNQQQEKGEAAATPAALKPTGKTEKIGGYRTDGYTFAQGSVQAEYFLAEDFPDLANALAQLQAFQRSGVNRMAESAVNLDVSKLPGFPMRTIMVSDGKKIVSTVQSVDQKELPASTFEVPEDYETTEIPMLPPMDRERSR